MEFSAIYVQTSQNPVATGYNRFADIAFASLLIHKLPLLLDLPLYQVTKFHTAHYLNLTPPSLISLAINPCYFNFGVYLTLKIKVFWEVTLMLLGGEEYIFFFLHFDTIKVHYSPTNAQMIVLKTVSKFTLKQLRHVSVQSHHLQGALLLNSATHTSTRNICSHITTDLIIH
jgi:hypothetical protein